MNYELAKKLKNLGFPQRQEWAEVTAYGTTSEQVAEGQERITKPTLSELIEMCKGKLGNLYQTNSGWGTHILGIREPATFGSTPEEAVANLWIELNK